MTFFEEVRKEIEPLFQEILIHPFIQELLSGQLSQEKFIFYLQQDWMYLNDFSKALSNTAVLAPSGEDRALLLKFSQEVKICEQELHHTFFKKYGVSSYAHRSPSCWSYTSFFRVTLEQEGYAPSLIALLPCFSIYHEVGQYIHQNSSSLNPYADWIELYASEEFGTSVNAMIRLCNKVSKDLESSLRNKLKDIFKTSAYYEWQFWDDAYFLRTLKPST